LDGQTSSWVGIAIYFGIFVLIFYLLIIAPRKKQEKKHNELMENLKRGEKVVTIGGIHGEVARIKDDIIVLKVGENTEISFIRKAIAYKVMRDD
jgi:preprotein translocase subunit YajC